MRNRLNYITNRIDLILKPDKVKPLKFPSRVYTFVVNSISVLLPLSSSWSENQLTRMHVTLVSAPLHPPRAHSNVNSSLSPFLNCQLSEFERGFHVCRYRTYPSSTTSTYLVRADRVCIFSVWFENFSNIFLILLTVFVLARISLSISLSLERQTSIRETTSGWYLEFEFLAIKTR